MLSVTQVTRAETSHQDHPTWPEEIGRFCTVSDIRPSFAQSLRWSTGSTRMTGESGLNDDLSSWPQDHRFQRDQSSTTRSLK